MKLELLWENFPHIWHMAEDGSWPSIRDRGLLSTSALLDLYEVTGAHRASIETQQRPRCVTITRSGIPDAVIRDQKPMSDGGLQKCLEDGLVPADWYRTLNERVFFWLCKERLHTLLGARAYRNKPQIVLTVETRSLVQAYVDRIELSPINSGSTIYTPVPRGLRTFLPIEEYDYEHWRKKRGKKAAAVELTVYDAIRDINDHVIAVQHVIGSSVTEIWRRPGVDPNVGI